MFAPKEVWDLHGQPQPKESSDKSEDYLVEEYSVELTLALGEDAK